MSAPAPRLDQGAIDALQNALAAEHAAVWSYSLAVAFLSGQDVQQAREDEDAHRELRNQIAQTLSQLGTPPVSAQPSYATPEPVTDGPTAEGLAVVAETDALAAWRSLLEHTNDRELRQAALDALTAGALRCARWRTAVGTPPAILVFPGRP
jgi:hypothetical protein